MYGYTRKRIYCRVIGGSVEHGAPSWAEAGCMVGVHPYLPPVCFLGSRNGSHPAVYGRTVRLPPHAQAALVSTALYCFIVLHCTVLWYCIVLFYITALYCFFSTAFTVL